jgi:hypothetical protein
LLAKPVSAKPLILTDHHLNKKQRPKKTAVIKYLFAKRRREPTLQLGREVRRAATLKEESAEKHQAENQNQRVYDYLYETHRVT